METEIRQQQFELRKNEMAAQGAREEQEIHEGAEERPLRKQDPEHFASGQRLHTVAFKQLKLKLSPLEDLDA